MIEPRLFSGIWICPNSANPLGFFGLRREMICDILSPGFVPAPSWAQANGGSKQAGFEGTDHIRTSHPSCTLFRLRCLKKNEQSKRLWMRQDGGRKRRFHQWHEVSHTLDRPPPTPRSKPFGKSCQAKADCLTGTQVRKARKAGRYPVSIRSQAKHHVKDSPDV